MHDLAIRARGLGKRYWIGGPAKQDTLRDTLGGVLTAPFRRAAALARGHGSAAETGHQALWALRDADFDIPRGASVGIVGRNGAGKSTLLKILSRITAPTAGHVELTGRVASLLEVGTGFHPDLTGEENIYLNGSILGMTRREVKQRFGQIAEFAGVEKFLRTAVKHYSSGMYTRLAFAVAAHLESEILIVDEVLAVGDAEFQRRCLDRMDDITGGGRTVLFVSHNLAAVESLCQSALLIQGGRITHRGTPAEVIQQYLRTDHDGGQQIPYDHPRKGHGRARVTRVGLLDDRGQPAARVSIGQPFILELHYRVLEGPRVAPHFVIVLSSQTGQKITRLATRDAGVTPPDLAGEGRVRVHVRGLPLLPGRYLLTPHLEDRDGVADRVENAVALELTARDVYGSGKLPPAERGFLLYCDTRWDTDLD